MQLTILLRIMTAALTLSSVGAGVIENFENGSPQDYYTSKPKIERTFETGPSPGGKGKAGKISWNADKYKYAEVSLKQRPQLPHFDQGSAKVTVYAPVNSPVHHLGLRLIDAKGEVFQWRKAVCFPKAGKYIVDFEVTPENASTSWGGRHDKKLDQPVKFLGFGIDYKKKSGKSYLWLDDISFNTAGGGKVDCTATPAAFNNDELWKLSAFSGSGKLNQTSSGLELTGNAGGYLLIRRKWSLLDYAVPRQLKLDCRLLAGSAAISVKFKGRGKTVATTSPVKLVKGQDQYILTIPAGKLQGPLKIEYIKVSKTNPDTRIKFLRLESVYQDYPVNAINVTVDTENPLHLLTPGNERKLAVKFSNISTRTISFRTEITLRDFFGNKVSCSDNFSLPAESSQNWKLPVIPVKYGIWWIDYTVTDLDAKDSSRSGQTSFAYMKPAGPTPGKPEGFIFGMCTHTERWSKRDRELEVLATALCGAKIVRTGPSWGRVEPQAGKWKWELADEIVNAYAAKNIDMQFILAFTPRWAAPAEKQKSRNWLEWSRCQPELNAWRNYVRTFSSRYRKNCDYWEIWNEPDIGFFRGNIEQYLKMMKIAFEELRKVDPKLKVMTGGFASMSHPKQKKNFHRDVLLHGKKDFDVHAFHAHGSFDRYVRTIDEQFLPLRKSTGTTVPWYANETAISSMDGAEKFQAETLYKKLLFAWARDAIAYNWYDLRNDGFRLDDAEHQYGLMTNDFYPKAAYPVYNALALNFSGLKFERQLELGKNLWAFTFRGNNTLLIPAWTEAAGSGGKHVVLETNASKAESVDMMGNVTPQAVTDGMVVLEVAPLPATLKLSGSAIKAKVHGSLVEVPVLPAALPGDKLMLKVMLFNPLAVAGNYKLTLVPPPGLSGSNNAVTVRLAGKKHETVELALDVAADLPTSLGKPLKLKLLYELVGSGWSGSVDVPVNPAMLIKCGSSETESDFVAAGRDKVVSLFEADPGKAHLLWKNAADLSVKVKLNADKNNLYVKAQVTDDIHRQQHHGVNVWKGDNIQLALQLPGQSGFWEIGLTRTDGGNSEAFVWQSPSGFKVGDVARKIKLTTARKGTVTTYNAAIPLTAIGASMAKLQNGIRFNLLVNDDDGEGREGWMHLAPGLGSGKNPAQFPFVVFR